MSGAPTPTGVSLDYSHQEFAGDQHGEGLIHRFGHSNLAEQRVQYGAALSLIKELMRPLAIANTQKFLVLSFRFPQQ
jgi:hypothetical protein